MSGKDEPCYINALSPELIDNILIHVDSIRTLSNIFVVSRFIHQCFTARREALILGVLQNELGPVLADAQFLPLFPPATHYDMHEDSLSYQEHVYAMAPVYEDLLSRGGDDENADSASLTELCRTLHEMNFMTDICMEMQRERFRIYGLSMVPAPSRSERLRVLRALYRRQIIFNMWAMGRRALAWGDADNAALINSNDSAGESLGLLAPLQSWEMQQVDDVNQIVIRVCLSLCAAGLDQGQPIDEDLFDEMCVHTNVLVQFMWEHPALSEGLPMVVPISSDSGPDGLWNYYGLSRTYKLSYLAWPWWEQWIGRGPVDAQEDEGGQGEGNTRGRLDFTVDRVHLVPFAWADALGGRIVNCFGEVLCEGISEAAAESEYELRSRSSSIELWSAVGFSLWDRQRVETLKGLSQLGEFHTGWILRWHVVPR